ncbi:MAG: flavin reductase family protein [Betaproteobacteria bacterium]|nr:flavin reductase family protein [Betaproteobacteria bacterium]
MNAEGHFDTRAFRSALGSFATGVTVITARGANDELAGLTVNSFASVSLDPPLVLWSLSLYSPALAVFQHCSHYAINVLAADQADLSEHFARPTKDRTGEKFHTLKFDTGMGGAPLLPGCCARFECRNETRHAGGDHLIFVGLVEKFMREERAPLLFQGGQYRRLATP